jgi:hypothetical protein
MNSLVITEISQLVLRERQGRDRGWWIQMADCFHQQSFVDLSWFRGTGAEFVAASKERRLAGGAHPVHRMSPPVIHQSDDRAIAEISAVIELRSVIDGTEVDLASYTRLMYRVENSESKWLVRDLTCIYERDTLTPVLPGAAVTIDYERLARHRTPCRYLGYFFGLHGVAVRPDVYGEDQPERLERLYDAAFKWMYGTEDD